MSFVRDVFTVAVALALEAGCAPKQQEATGPKAYAGSLRGYREARRLWREGMEYKKLRRAASDPAVIEVEAHCGPKRYDPSTTFTTALPLDIRVEQKNLTMAGSQELPVSLPRDIFNGCSFEPVLNQACGATEDMRVDITCSTGAADDAKDNRKLKGLRIADVQIKDIATGSPKLAFSKHYAKDLRPVPPVESVTCTVARRAPVMTEQQQQQRIGAYGRCQ